MCLETMEKGSKHTKPDCLRKNMKPGSKFRWRLVRVSTEEDEACKPCRASAVRAPIRKTLRREQRPPRLGKLSKILEDMGNTRETVYERRPAAACVQRPPPGAMAPENTTQYLMGNVYEDMKTDDVHTLPVSHDAFAELYAGCLSPRSVYTALDSDFDGCLAFQQRDFEEAFELCW